MSPSAEKLRRGVLYCCINFDYRKSFGEEVGEYQDFPSKVLCLTVPKKSVGESLTAALILGNEKVCIRKWVYQGFRSKIFCLTVPKFSVGESIFVALFSGSEKVWIGGGGSIEIFRRKVYVSQCGNFS